MIKLSWRWGLMTQMEEIAYNIEKYRSYLINLISCKDGLGDDDVILASQNLDKHLNIYNKVMPSLTNPSE
jgi:hypothetical protein